MFAKRKPVCQTCRHALTDQGECSNEACSTKRPTQPPHESGKRPIPVRLDSVTQVATLACKNCGKPFDIRGSSCPNCKTSRATSNTYSYAFVKNVRERAQADASSEFTSEEPPTSPDMSSVRRSLRPPRP